MDLILLFIFGGALYHMAQGYNIRPWRWVGNFVAVFMITMVVVSFILFGIYGKALLDDPAIIEKVKKVIPITLLYQFILFMYFRSLMKKYVTYLDKVDAANDTMATHPKNDSRDFSHFR